MKTRAQPRRMDRIAFSPRWWIAACCFSSLIYLLIQMSVYGVIFYLPQQVAALLGTTVGFHVGLVAALPWLCALAVTWYVPRRADRTGEASSLGFRVARHGGSRHRPIGARA